MTSTVRERNLEHPRGRRGAPLVTVGLALACVLLVPAAAAAQSGIAGVVRDTSGAVLPGVTVEATSPALIEKVRVAVSDGQGRYNIVDLRPGTYVVTFTLSGFRAFKRDGIVLPSGFTATVNAELSVGGVEETITVTGGAPVVDIQSVVRQETLSNELIEAVPSQRLPQSFTALTPGAEQNAASQTAPGGSYLATVMSFHGRQESQYFYDGFNFSHHMSDRAQHAINQGLVQEIVVTAGAAGASQQAGGLVTNVIPKEGGNQFSGQVYFHFANEDFLGDNQSEELKALNVNTSNTRFMRDVNPGFGGPILQDRLWFYGSYRHNLSKVASPALWDTDPLDWVYEPDLSRPPPAQTVTDENYTLRLTWQALDRHKIAADYDHGPRKDENRDLSTTRTPAAAYSTRYMPIYKAQLTWKSPWTNRLFLEGGAQYFAVKWDRFRIFKEPGTGQPVSPDMNAVAAQEETTGVFFRGWGDLAGVFNRTNALRVRAAANYITGTHAFKVGMELGRGSYFVDQFVNNDYWVSLRNGRPVQMNLVAPRRTLQELAADLSLYAQDQWTIRRLTLNAGVRYDYFNTNLPVQETPAGRFTPARQFEAIGQVVGWHDVSPRLGFAYDLFGTGRTAVKATLNRYVNLEGVNSSLTAAFNPVSRSVLAANRAWTDGNGDFLPQCDFSNPAANGECGALSNLNFGLGNPRARDVDPALLTGFGTRGYNWETTAGVQHELLRGLAVGLSYTRRWFGNFTVTDNTLIGPADFDPFCITVPSDPRLPGGGGYEQCGYYDVKPAKFGQSEEVITFSENFGDESLVYDGIDITIGARLPNGLQLTGGTVTGRVAQNTCRVVDSPQDLLFCDVKLPPFQTTLKLIGVYPLPWYGIQVSGSFQSLPGPHISDATISVSSAAVAPSLGRPLSGGRRAVTLPLVEPGTLYGSQYNKLDLRLSKIFQIRGTRLTASVDMFNALNAAGVISVNTRYGTQFATPNRVLGARFFRVAGQFDF